MMAMMIRSPLGTGKRCSVSPKPLSSPGRSCCSNKSGWVDSVSVEIFTRKPCTIRAFRLDAIRRPLLPEGLGNGHIGTVAIPFPVLPFADEETGMPNIACSIGTIVPAHVSLEKPPLAAWKIRVAIFVNEHVFPGVLLLLQQLKRQRVWAERRDNSPLEYILVVL